MLMQVNSLYCLAENFKMQQVDEEKVSCLSQMYDVMNNKGHFEGTLARSTGFYLKSSQNHL